MKIKANKFFAVILILTAVLFTGCGSKNNSADEGELTRSVVTAGEVTEASKAETTTTTSTTKQTTTTTAVTTSQKTKKTTAEKQTTKVPETTKKKKSSKKKTTTATVTEEAQAEEEPAEYQNVRFRSKKLLNSHYEKHGIEMGFASAEEYEKAACAVVNNPDALHKTEKEDGDDVYYVEASNEFVVVSKDGYLRTYFNPSKGKAYYDKQ